MIRTPCALRWPSMSLYPSITRQSLSASEKKREVSSAEPQPQARQIPKLPISAPIGSLTTILQWRASKMTVRWTCGTRPTIQAISTITTMEWPSTICAWQRQLFSSVTSSSSKRSPTSSSGIMSPTTGSRLATRFLSTVCSSRAPASSTGTGPRIGRCKAPHTWCPPCSSLLVSCFFILSDLLHIDSYDISYCTLDE